MSLGSFKMEEIKCGRKDYRWGWINQLSVLTTGVRSERVE